MTPLKFDSLDRRLLARLDPDFAIDDSGEVASVNGPMRIEIVRVADDQLELTIEFSELEFPILLPRARTMERLGVKDES